MLLPLDPKRETSALFVNAQEPETPAVAKPIAALLGRTPREVTILLPMLEGKTIEEIAEGLGISLATGPHASRTTVCQDPHRPAGRPRAEGHECAAARSHSSLGFSFTQPESRCALTRSRRRR